ncbi:hypothetical protein [Actinacidiphila soli]|uniref:hypothetical protein n=1 Tax=Actinacidiphila soli TaxID=2487275 RepID=UPI000FCACBF8|nr:hypothetical protein [Actinacidiphila soli]
MLRKRSRTAAASAGSHSSNSTRRRRRLLIGLRPPASPGLFARVNFYDQEQFEAFYAGLQQRKKKLLPTDPELYDGDVEDRISINQAAAWFNFAGPGVIRKYLGGNPGYFPEAVGTVEGPTGRQIPAFRRGDLQDFDRKRTGDNTGAAGSPAGPQSRGRKPETEQRHRPRRAARERLPPRRRRRATSTTAPTCPLLVDEGQPRRRGHRPAPLRSPLRARPVASLACSRAAAVLTPHDSAPSLRLMPR